VNARTKLIVPCKNGGVCIKNPKNTGDIICKGCEREIIRWNIGYKMSPWFVLNLVQGHFQNLFFLTAWFSDAKKMSYVLLKNTKIGFRYNIWTAKVPLQKLLFKNFFNLPPNLSLTHLKRIDLFDSANS